MGHKGPVLRPRCIGTGRAWTQLLFYPIPFTYRLVLFFRVLTVLLLFRLFLALFTGGLSCFHLLWTPINLLYASHDRLLRPKDELIFRDERKYFTLRDDEIYIYIYICIKESSIIFSAGGERQWRHAVSNRDMKETAPWIFLPNCETFLHDSSQKSAAHNLQQSHSVNKLHFALNVQCFSCL